MIDERIDMPDLVKRAAADDPSLADPPAEERKDLHYSLWHCRTVCSYCNADYPNSGPNFLLPVVCRYCGGFSFFPAAVQYGSKYFNWAFKIPIIGKMFIKRYLIRDSEGQTIVIDL